MYPGVKGNNRATDVTSYGRKDANPAIAHVARRVFRLGKSSIAPAPVPPAASSAAASATDAVPVLASGSVDGFGTGTAASSSAVNPRTGTPSRAAAATIPGSAVRASSVPTDRTRSTASPASRSAAPISPSTSSTATPALAPMPRCTSGVPSDSKAPWQ